MYRSSCVLIETLWNVNFSVDTQQGLLSTVLIETLWNVNTIVLIRPVVNPIVLIETLWNVNCRKHYSTQHME